MPRRSSIFNFNKVPRAFLTALILIALCETAFSVLWDHFYIANPNSRFDIQGGVSTEFKNDLSRIPGHPFDVIILGDSYGTIGLVPGILERKIGLRCFNFSTNGPNTVFHGYCLLKNYLSANAPHRPRILLLAFSMHQWAKSQPEMPVLYNYARGNLCVIAAEIGWGRTLKLLVPSLKIQPMIRSLVRDPSRVRYLRGDKRKLFHKAYDVYMVRQLTQTDLPEDFRAQPELFGELQNYGFKVNPFSLKYFTRILDLTQKNNIRVLVVITTKQEKTQEIFEQDGQIERYREWIGKLQNRYPGMRVLAPQRALRRESLYFDPFHLNQNGSTVLTHAVAAELKQLVSKRWIKVS